MPWPGPGTTRLAMAAPNLRKVPGHAGGGVSCPRSASVRDRPYPQPTSHRSRTRPMSCRTRDRPVCMTELRVHNFSISLDGYGAGPDQSEENPLGFGGEQLHEWIFPPEGERTAADDLFVQRGVDGIGATIMGRNMFGPVRGGWD